METAQKNIITSDSMVSRFIAIAEKENLDMEKDFETIMLLALCSENELIKKVTGTSKGNTATSVACKRVCNKINENA